LRIVTALATALLCGVSLFGSSVSQAAFPAKWNGTGCFSYKALHTSNTVCDYGFGQPFVLKGYSKGGSSTLSYTVQCRKGTHGPMNKALIDRRIWYKRSITVRGNFKVYGAKGAFPATRHCVAAQGKGPVLAIKLRMGRSATRTNLVIRLDSNLPGGN
jgi:hypothetical protein